VADIGYIALVLSFFICICTAAILFWGQMRKNSKLTATAQIGVFAVFGLVSLSAIILIYALMTHDFQLEYVASYTSRDMSWPYLLSAFWAGNAGSLLLWGWLVTFFAVVMVLWRRKSTKELLHYASSVAMLASAFFLLLLVFIVNPFAKLSVVPADGSGLNPLLQNPGMIFHPPALLAGFAALTFPLAFAMAALIAKRKDRDWLVDLRRWTLIAWILLSVGNVLGAWWAYVELGWGGYWGWDPVENMSFIPWAVTTALLHSIILQRTKGGNGLWTSGLAIVAFNLAILATFITRTDVLSSVHAFNNTGIGPALLGFIALGLIIPLVLLYSRRNILKSDRKPSPTLSKESGFQAINIIFLAVSAIVLVATLFPLISQLANGSKANLSPSFYNIVVGPIFLVIILLVGICTLTGWRHEAALALLRRLGLPLILSIILGITLALATSIAGWAAVSFALCAFAACAILIEAYRMIKARSQARGENPVKALAGSLSGSRVRYGAMIIHLGIILIAVGVIGSSALTTQKNVSLSPGQSTNLNQYTLTYDDLQSRNTTSMYTVRAILSVQNSGHAIDQLTPEKVFYISYAQPVTEVAIHSTLREDLYVILAGWSSDNTAQFTIMVRPAVKWIWIGGGFLMFGGLIALWTPRRAKPETPERGKGLPDQIDA
jgi:cytochrome c-type biogenesis protein CcmF